mgnify:CR=1 FL=1
MVKDVCSFFCLDFCIIQWNPLEISIEFSFSIINNIIILSLEETVTNLFAVKGIKQLLELHAEDLVENKAMDSNQTTMTK